MKFPSFEELAELVRVSARLKRNERIDPDTQLWRDLKLNEKQGIELLSAIERLRNPTRARNSQSHAGHRFDSVQRYR
jgi:hypothetical protein